MNINKEEEKEKEKNNQNISNINNKRLNNKSKIINEIKNPIIIQSPIKNTSKKIN